MPDYSLVPVDHQPDLDDHSLVPVDHDPFAADGLAQQAQFQLAQAQPQQQPSAGAGQPDAGAPAASDGIGPTGGAPNPDQVAKAAPFGDYANPTPTDPRTSTGGLFPLVDENHMVESYVYKKTPLALRQPALRLLLPTVVTRLLPLTAPTALISVGFMGKRLKSDVARERLAQIPSRYADRLDHPLIPQNANK